jgi:hypothetical protein
VNTDAPWPTAEQAEAWVLGIQTKLHQWHGLVESRMRGDTHVRFGGGGRGTRSSERAIPRPGPTPTRPALRAASGCPPARQRHDSAAEPASPRGPLAKGLYYRPIMSGSAVQVLAWHVR